MCQHQYTYAPMVSNYSIDLQKEETCQETQQYASKGREKEDGFLVNMAGFKIFKWSLQIIYKEGNELNTHRVYITQGSFKRSTYRKIWNTPYSIENLV